MIRRGTVTCLCIALVLAGGLAACTDAPPPRIPDPLLDGMEQRVAGLLRRSRETVVAQPYSADAWGTLGAVYQAHRLLTEADRCYLRAIELDPGDFRWIYLRAVTREVAGAGAEELQRLFGAAARRRPNYTAVQVRLGDAMSSRGRLHAAREAFERALHLDTDLSVAHRGLGQVLLALGDVGRGVSELERSVTLDPRDGSAWAALARARNRAGDPAAATVAAERALQLGDSAGAISDPVFEEEIVGRGASGMRSLARAGQKLRAGDFAGALEDLRVADETHPEDSVVQYWMGNAYRGLQQPVPAIGHYRRAIELNPEMDAAHVGLATTLEEQGRPAEALPHFEAAVALKPDVAVNWFSLARCRFRLGNRVGAAEGLEQVLRLAPDNGPAQRLLRELLDEQ